MRSSTEIRSGMVEIDKLEGFFLVSLMTDTGFVFLILKPEPYDANNRLTIPIHRGLNLNDNHNLSDTVNHINLSNMLY
jgi:hypothetical protein